MPSTHEIRLALGKIDKSSEKPLDIINENVNHFLKNYLLLLKNWKVRYKIEMRLLKI